MLGSDLHEDKKWEYCEALYEGMYGSKTSYEAASHIRVEAPKIVCKAFDIGAEEDLLAQLDRRVQKEVDFMHSGAKCHEKIFRLIVIVMRKLATKSPEFIVPVVLMYLPRFGEPMGTCSLLPGGVGKVPSRRSLKTTSKSSGCLSRGPKRTMI